jgi:phage terminase large subunit
MTDQKFKDWVSPDLDRESLRRYLKKQRLKNNLSAQQEELDRCRKDVVYWINEWAWTYDPRNISRSKPALVPFVLFDFQKEYLLWRRDRLAKRESGICEKSRDSGASWLAIADQCHHWLFDKDFKGAVGSRKEMLVDRLGDMDSLFQKLRFLIQYLPSWMRPNKYSDGKLRFVNHDNGSVITGEAGTNIGRGGRNTLYDVDEAAFLDQAESIDAALSNNTETVYYTSTPNGAANVYAQKRFSGNVPVFTMNWQDDPRKNQEWLDKKIAEWGQTIVNREILINYDDSIDNVVIESAWIKSAVNRSQMLNYGVRQVPFAGLDVARSGSCESVLTIMSEGTVLFQKAWNTPDLILLAKEAQKLCNQYYVNLLVIDGVGVGAGVVDYLNQANPGFKVFNFMGGAAASNLFWQNEKISSKDKFINARAEAYFLVRERFRKTHEYALGLREYPGNELISIPDDPKLQKQLGSVTWSIANDKRIKIESKEDLTKRGVPSPDYFDSLAYCCYAPIVATKLFVQSSVRTR